jgi:hypothetical protein
MAKIISNEEYKKIKNFFKGIYKAKDWAILKYVNIFSTDDLTHDYILFVYSGNEYKTPKEFYFRKLRNAYNRKRIAPETHMSKMTSSDSDSFDGETKELVIENPDCKFSLSKASKTDDEKTLDLCIVGLGEVLKGFSYHIEKILSHRGLTENERYYLKLALDSLLKSSSNSLNFTETELLNIASESLRKNSAEELFNLEDRIKDLESNYTEFLSEDGVFLLQVCKMILRRDKTEYLLHPATKEEVGERKQLSEQVIKDLSKDEVFKLTFLGKCILAGKTEKEIKLIQLLNQEVATMLSYEELVQLKEKHLCRFKPEDLFKLSYRELLAIMNTTDEQLQ